MHHEPKSDQKYFLRVFVAFTTASLIMTAIFLYNVGKLLEGHRSGKYEKRVEDGQLHVWSLDPLVMHALAGTRPHDPSDKVALIEINFNDTCFGFVWTKFHISNIKRYELEITNMKVPAMPAIRSGLRELDLEYFQCQLNVSTPYLVKLTAVGNSPGSEETAAGLMWTTHQVPPTPGQPRVVYVTETSITVSLTETMLTEGPLTVVEVRVQPGERDGELAQQQLHHSPWFFQRKRDKRHAVNHIRPVRTADVSHFILDPVQNTKSTGSTQNRSTDSFSGDAVTINLGSETLAEWTKTGRTSVISNKGESDKDSRVKDVRAKMLEASPNRGGRKHISDEDTLDKENGWMSRTVWKKVAEGPNHSPQRALTEVRDETVLRFIPGPRRDYTVGADFGRVLLRTRGWDRGRAAVHRAHMTYLGQDYMPGSGGRVNGPYMPGSGTQHLRRGVKTDLRLVYDLSRPRRKATLFQLASSEDGLLLLRRLLKNMEAILRSDVFAGGSRPDMLYLSQVVSNTTARDGQRVTWRKSTSLPGRTVDIPGPAGAESTSLPDRTVDIPGPAGAESTSLPGRTVDISGPAGAESTSLPGRTIDIPGPAGAESTSLPGRTVDVPDQAEAEGGESAHADKMAANVKEGLGRIKIRPTAKSRPTVKRTRTPRSTSGLARRSLLGPEAVTESEDQLDVDPYQTRHVLGPINGQHVLVKSGYGYFVTDHYGMRQPYFNNSKLERCLRRLARFEEMRDFILYSKALANVTSDLKDIDVTLIYNRLTKVIGINSRRRLKLFLDMFEDFLFWKTEAKEDKAKAGGQTVPHAAKLGLPPGIPVARVSENSLAQNLTIGDNSMYGGLPNPPLVPGREYQVVVAILSTVADVTKHSWISINVTTLARGTVHYSSTHFLVLAMAATCLGMVLVCFVLPSKWTDTRTFNVGTWEDVRLQIDASKTTESQHAHQVYPTLIVQPSPPAHGHGKNFAGARTISGSTSSLMTPSWSRTDNDNEVSEAHERERRKKKGK